MKYLFNVNCNFGMSRDLQAICYYDSNINLTATAQKIVQVRSSVAQRKWQLVECVVDRYLIMDSDVGKRSLLKQLHCWFLLIIQACLSLWCTEFKKAHNGNSRKHTNFRMASSMTMRKFWNGMEASSLNHWHCQLPLQNEVHTMSLGLANNSRLLMHVVVALNDCPLAGALAELLTSNSNWRLMTKCKRDWSMPSDLNR